MESTNDTPLGVTEYRDVQRKALATLYVASSYISPDMMIALCWAYEQAESMFADAMQTTSNTMVDEASISMCQCCLLTFIAMEGGEVPTDTMEFVHERSEELADGTLDDEVMMKTIRERCASQP